MTAEAGTRLLRPELLRLKAGAHTQPSATPYVGLSVLIPNTEVTVPASQHCWESLLWEECLYPGKAYEMVLFSLWGTVILGPRGGGGALECQPADGPPTMECACTRSQALALSLTQATGYSHESLYPGCLSFLQQGDHTWLPTAQSCTQENTGLSRTWAPWHRGQALC